MVRGERLVGKLARTEARVTELTAPAGFGKSALARSIGQAIGAYEMVAHSGEALIRALETNSGSPFVAILDDVESISEEHVASIASAIEWAPLESKIVLCSRRRTELHRNVLIAPNERLALGADDLAFRQHETESLFADLALDNDAVAAIHEFCEGWPVATLSVRRALRDAEVTPGKELLSSHAFLPLVSYLLENVVEPLTPDERSALLICSALPGLRREQIVKAIGHPAAAFALVEHGLARFDATQGLRPRRILQKLVCEQFADELAAMLEDTGRRLRDAGHPLYAAVSFANAGDAPSAEEALRDVASDPKQLTQLPFQALSDDARLRLTGDILKAYPHLWSALFIERQYQEPPAALLRDALDVAELVDRASPLRSLIAAFAAMLCTQTGNTDLGYELLQAAGEDAERDPALLCARAVLDLHIGKARSAQAAWNSVRSQFWGLHAWATQMMRTELRTSAFAGDRSSVATVATRMLAAAEKSGSTILVANVLAIASYSAWLFGDDELLDTWLERLKLLLRNINSPALEAIARSFSGTSGDPLLERPVYRGWARLIAAGASNAPRSAELLDEAIRAADESADFTLRLLSRAAMGKLIPERASLLEEASRAILQTAGTQEQVAVEHPFTRLELFQKRFHPATPAGETQVAPPALNVELASGRIHRGGKELKLSLKTTELLIALASEGKPMSRDALVEKLWSDQPADSARSALKMAVHRARHQIGDQDAIISVQGCYALGEKVCTDAARLFGRDLPDSDRTDIERLFDSLRAGRPAHFAGWDWFLPFEEALIALTTELGLSLATRAFKNGDIDKALEYASVLTTMDACNESATELIIRAHLERGERGLAVSRYQRLIHSLRRELDVAPSETIRTLFD